MLFSAIESRTAQRVLLARPQVASGDSVVGPADSKQDASAISVASGASSLATSHHSDRSEPHAHHPGQVDTSKLGVAAPAKPRSRTGSSFSATSNTPGMLAPASPGHMSPGSAVATSSTRAVSGRAYTRPQTFTVTVGKKPSAAGFFVDDPHSVEELLRGLARSTAKSRLHHSMVDLRTVDHSSSWIGRRQQASSGSSPLGGSSAGPREGTDAEQGTGGEVALDWSATASGGGGDAVPGMPHAAAPDGEMGWAPGLQGAADAWQGTTAG